MKFILYFLVTAGLIWGVAFYGGADVGIVLEGPNQYVSALIFSVILTVVNLILGTLLRIITIPLSILTLGLFFFVIMFFIIWVTTELYTGVALGDGTLRGSAIPYLVIAIIPTISNVLLGRVK